jgi:hypothetical protein
VTKRLFHLRMVSEVYSGILVSSEDGTYSPRMERDTAEHEIECARPGAMPVNDSLWATAGISG